MKAAVILLFLTLAYIQAQEQNTCPVDWEMHHPDGKEECKCFFFAQNNERLTHADASLICHIRDGWLAELDDGAEDNYWVVEQLVERNTRRYSQKMMNHNGNELGEPHFEDQWWIGAKSHESHDEHHWGDWRWEHINTSVTWFDWAPEEPNDRGQQQCLTFLRYDYGDKLTYQWNDWNCDTVADYICEKLCSTPIKTSTLPPTTLLPTTTKTTTIPTTTKPTPTSHPTTMPPTTNLPSTTKTTTIPPTPKPTTTLHTTTIPPTTPPRTTNLPTTNIVTTNPSTTPPHTTMPPATTSPTINPPTTKPPTTMVPTTHYTSTRLPTTASPTTNMQTTEPPTTRQPSTHLPTTRPKTTIYQTTVPTVHPTTNPEEYKLRKLHPRFILNTNA